MKKTPFAFLFVFTAITARADFKTFQFQNYDLIIDLIYEEIETKGSKNLLVVFDIDKTLLETVNCLPGPNAITNSLLFFEKRVRFCNGDLTSIKAPALINELKSLNIPVMALTARRSAILEATLSQLEKRLVVDEDEPAGELSLTFETAPSYSDEQVTLDFKAFGIFNKDLAIKRGVAMAGGGNKGHALKTFLKHHKDLSGEDFNRIIFIDDNRRNIRNLEEAFENTKEYMSIVHYTEFVD